MIKQIEIKGKEHLVKTCKWKDFVKIQNLPSEERTEKLIKICSGLTEEEYEDLDLQEGLSLIDAVNEVCGLTSENFRQTLKEDKQN